MFPLRQRYTVACEQRGQRCSTVLYLYSNIGSESAHLTEHFFVGGFSYSFQENTRIHIIFLRYSSRQDNKYFKINQSNCLHWSDLITATSFGPYLESSSDSFIKYVSLYWNILISIHVSVNRYNHHNKCNYCENSKKIFKFLNF